MSAPHKITVEELNENLEVSGKRPYGASTVIIPFSDPPEELAGLRIRLNADFQLVEAIEIGWLDAEKYVDYALANDSLWYLEMTVRLPCPEEQYDRPWDVFRNAQVEELAKTLGQSSWGFGQGIASRRGQGMFVVELFGLECPMWVLFLSVRPTDTYKRCWEIAETVEEFFVKRWSKRL